MAFSNSGMFSGDIYDGQRYYSEQERRYREERERRRHADMQNAVYNPNTDTYRGMSAQQQEEHKPVKAKTPVYLDNKLLLLEN
jgi:hypothetical protein